jgi:hypothetical protein
MIHTKKKKKQAPVPPEGFPPTHALAILSEELVNDKLANKLRQQLADPIAVTTGAMPSWCFQVRAAEFTLLFVMTQE